MTFPEEDSPQRGGDPIVRVDWKIAARGCKHAIIGAGIFLLFLVLLQLGGLVVFLSIFALKELAEFQILVTILVGAAGLVLWWISFQGASYLLDVVGVELHRNLVWVLLPAAPVLFPLLMAGHMVGGLGAVTRGIWQIIGFAFGLIFIGLILVAVLAPIQ